MIQRGDLYQPHVAVRDDVFNLAGLRFQQRSFFREARQPTSPSHQAARSRRSSRESASTGSSLVLK